MLIVTLMLFSFDILINSRLTSLICRLDRLCKSRSMMMDIINKPSIDTMLSEGNGHQGYQVNWINLARQQTVLNWVRRVKGEFSCSLLCLYVDQIS